TQVGDLGWSGGTPLGAAAFTGETASGWQQVTFGSPVAITAGTVYVASYFSPNGHYSGNADYFTTQGVDNPPLHALANGVSGGNGVYVYVATHTFPTHTFPTPTYSQH